jgi:hypothetical protein
VKKILQLSLGIITSVGGFLEIGSVTTSAQAGAQFGYQLLWPLLFGTICLVFLVEMSGRLAAVTRHSVVGAMRERFGFPFFFIVLVGITIVVFMVLVAELGGIAFSLQILTGIGFPWWALPVSLIVWVLMWKGTFTLIEYGALRCGRREGRSHRGASNRPQGQGMPNRLLPHRFIGVDRASVSVDSGAANCPRAARTQALLLV